jgi:hypothetical protein
MSATSTEVEATEPDVNEPDMARTERCRVTLRPDRWVWLTPGEMHDHERWGSLLEGPAPKPIPSAPVPTANTASKEASGNGRSGEGTPPTA